MDLGWKPEYNIGSERIDREHMVFLDLVREFVVEAETREEHKLLLRLSHEIYKYADFHFFSEERMMVRIGYAGFDHHQAAHKGLLEELRRYIDSLSIDSMRALEMADFLFKWFKAHTVSEDTKLAATIANFESQAAGC